MLRLFRSFGTRTVRPTEAVPDVSTFLQKIGRNMGQYAEHFDTWDSLMHVEGETLKAKGIDTRDRRYLLSWVEKYKQNIELREFKRGRKRWGGERNRTANRAAFYGRLRAERAKEEAQG